MAQQDLSWVFHEGSPLSAEVKALRWENTPVGRIESWPISWKVAVSICLASHFPIVCFLGEQLIQVYNCGYRIVMGNKHPTYLGRSVRESWAEVWDTIGPMFDQVMRTGQANWVTDQLLLVDRHNYTEESYWMFSYSALKSETGAVTGVFCALTEVTPTYLSNRRMRTVQQLTVRTASLATTPAVCDAAISVLSDNTADLPFSLLYLADGTTLHLVGKSGFLHLDRAPKQFDVSGVGKVWTDLSSTNPAFHSALLASLSGPAACMPTSDTFALTDFSASPLTSGTVFIPLRTTQSGDLLGLLVVGRNPRRALDDDYISFLGMTGGAITSALVTARDQEQTQQRMRSLAELDRARTAFFSSVSHEFRTPLTLLLGPLEALRHNPGLDSAAQEQAAMALRNARRMLLLVNALLDFSRLEAGRAKASFQPVNLTAVTRDLASVFRAACEQAGLELRVESDGSDPTVYVDIEMWEKIVLNLLSNAYNFTLRGGITVSVATDATHFILRVRDTGCGISATEISRVFERFFRASSKGRSHEGTGIGLSLVSELVQMHSGTIGVESKEGAGTVFTVRVPLGQAHLPPEHVSSAESRSPVPLTARTMDWLAVNAPPAPRRLAGSRGAGPVPRAVGERPATGGGELPCVLVADDNADMLAYVSDILSANYRVVSVRNGADALAVLRQAHSDVSLVVSDVMMPVLDGFELLRAIRTDPALSSLPVVFLSARAGEESRSDGMSAGADSYLIKPFSAKELLVIVDAHVRLNKARHAAARREKQLYEEAKRANEAKDRFLAVLSHELRTPLAPALLTIESLLADERVAPVRSELEVVLQSVRLETQIIGDLLDITRIRQGKLSLDKHPVNLNELVQQTAVLLGREASAKEQAMTIALSAERAQVLVDGTRMQQILWVRTQDKNLLGNAIKFTPRSGHIQLSSRNLLYNGVESIRVSVVDSGVGIEPDALPHIFDAFEQGNDDVTRRFGGLGLGLTIARALARLHDGALEASSQGKDSGATFSLTLPLVTSAAPLDLPTQPATLDLKRPRSQSADLLPDGEATSPMRILLVEDNEPTLLVMCKMLQRLRYSVTAASSVEAARRVLANASAGSFHLLVSDLGLPDGSGLDVLRFARSHHLWRDLKAIALSGFASQEDVARSLAAGFAEHLTKPISTKELAHALTRVLDSSAAT